MTQITFLTLFLGLVAGQQKISMNVTGPVSRVELQLDHRTLGTIPKAPWIATIDLGPHLLPHVLVAHALDETGTEVARAEQSLNLPQSLYAIQLLLERDAHGTPAAVQMLWHSLESDAPKTAEISLDNKPLALDGHLRAALPAVDLGTPHVIRGRAIAPSGIPSSTELAFGGGIEDQTGTHLTAIPVRLHKPITTPGDFEKALRIGDETPKVVAIEGLPAQVMVVRHPIRIEAQMRLLPTSLGFSRTIRDTGGGPDASTLTFIWPVAIRSEASSHADLFEWSAPRPFSNAENFKDLLALMPGPPTNNPLYANAVAIAALRATEGRRPRAVIFLRGSEGSDSSNVRVEQAREYLRALGVPLYVWTLGRIDTGEWGPATDISIGSRYRRAFLALEEDLKSQRIVWIEGDHLPADVRSVSEEVETLAH